MPGLSYQQILDGLEHQLLSKLTRTLFVDQLITLVYVAEPAKQSIMSIRRQSCDGCFRGRRKCDLTYPICSRCQRNRKSCHYVYPPHMPEGSAATFSVAADVQSSAGKVVGLSGERSAGFELLHQPRRDWLVRRRAELRPARPSRALRLRGGLEPVSGCTVDVHWVFEEIRSCPRAFASQSGTMFIHKGLFSAVTSPPLRTAFAMCSAVTSAREGLQEMMFKIMDTEISEWLVLTPTSTLLEDLAKLQAAVLYQIIRFFHGGLEERVTAERQEYLIRSYGLRLLQRMNTELSSLRPSWEVWVLMESIRRTVVVAFKLYTLYGTFRSGICTETRAIKMLPMSTMIGSWSSREIYLQYSDLDQLTTYEDFRTVLIAKPAIRELDSFERLVFAGCSGLDCGTLLQNQRREE